jgi:hypothetical protein
MGSVAAAAEPIGACSSSSLYTSASLSEASPSKLPASSCCCSSRAERSRACSSCLAPDTLCSAAAAQHSTQPQRSVNRLVSVHACCCCGCVRVWCCARRADQCPYLHATHDDYTQLRHEVAHVRFVSSSVCSSEYAVWHNSCTLFVSLCFVRVHYLLPATSKLNTVVHCVYSIASSQ